MSYSTSEITGVWTKISNLKTFLNRFKFMYTLAGSISQETGLEELGVKGTKYLIGMPFICQGKS